MQQRHRTTRSVTHRNSRPAFTLVELLISVSLVLLIMIMFAQVYQMATDTVVIQKGIRRNDQRARMLSTVLRSDLDNRSFVDVIPFLPDHDTQAAGPNYVPGNRRGYFSISENDPNNETDDVLSLTVIIPRDGSQTPYLGHARLLGPNIAASPNQPEFDDGNPNANSVGASQAAEVIFFLRNGNLYRRQLLVRESYADLSTPQPPLIPRTYGTAANPLNFWEDFSYSAFYRPGDGPRFHGMDSLDNLSTTTSDPAIQNWPVSLGVPHLRFGHSVAGGILPHEFIGTGASRRFIGRFLSRETADPDFQYPGRILTGSALPMGQTSGDPHLRTDLSLNSDGIVAQYTPSGNAIPSRRGESLLMTNVHAFDIKVWDDQLGSFVDLGHNGSGRYSATARHATRTGNNWNRYDTWHPFSLAGSSLGQPPFKPGSPALGNNAEIALKAIQITIRFYDVPTDKMRQVTIQHSLVN